MSEFFDNPIRKVWMEVAERYPAGLALMTGTQKVIYDAMREYATSVLNEYKNGDIGLDDLIAKVQVDFDNLFKSGEHE